MFGVHVGPATGAECGPCRSRPPRSSPDRPEQLRTENAHVRRGGSAMPSKRLSPRAEMASVPASIRALGGPQSAVRCRSDCLHCLGFAGEPASLLFYACQQQRSPRLSSLVHCIGSTSAHPPAGARACTAGPTGPAASTASHRQFRRCRRTTANQGHGELPATVNGHPHGQGPAHCSGGRREVSQQSAGACKRQPLARSAGIPADDALLPASAEMRSLLLVSLHHHSPPGTRSPSWRCCKSSWAAPGRGWCWRWRPAPASTRRTSPAACRGSPSSPQSTLQRACPGAAAAWGKCVGGRCGGGALGRSAGRWHPVFTQPAVPMSVLHFFSPHRHSARPP